MPTPEQLKNYQDRIRAEAKAVGLPEQLALGVAEQESSFNPMAVNPKIVKGESGPARGFFQLLPSTAARYKIDASDPEQNVRTGVRYLKELFDKHGGDLDKIAAEYGGVRTDPNYVPGVTAKVLNWQRQIGAGGGAQTTATAPSAPPQTWEQRHPILSSVIESADPSRREGRQNIAGFGGSVLGGTVGAGIGAALGGAAGIETGPGAIATATTGGLWGRRIGSAVGAGLAGAAEHLLLEETPLGDLLSKGIRATNAGALSPVARRSEPPPAPDSTWYGRTAGAGAYQLGADVLGQGVLHGAKQIGKYLLQGKVAQGAFNFFTEQRQKALDALQAGLDALTEEAERST